MSGQESTKKRPPEGGRLRAVVSRASRGQKERAAADPTGICRACAENHCKAIIPDSREKASPNLDEEGGDPPMSGWVLALTVIGTGWVTRLVFWVIDWIER